MTDRGQGYTLYIANKNYSSWSLRPWSLMRELGIGFAEQLVRFGDAKAWQQYRSVAPSGKVPCLIDGDLRVWDSMSIAEYLHERHAGVWPQDAAARAWARSAAAEMHSGFQELRGQCSMSCGIRIRLFQHTPGLERDMTRLGVLWSEGLQRFGGPFLAGSAFSAADAFFAPVMFRVQTYGLKLSADGEAYAAHMLRQRSLVEWYAEALAERFRDAGHDAGVAKGGEVTADLRAAENP
jgi:glutathione S-transferase